MNTNESSQTPVDAINTNRMPAFFISHGGGPCFFMDSTPGDVFYEMSRGSEPAKWYLNFAKKFVPRKPKAIILISAHWEESVVHITSQPNPKLYFDYYGFPDHTYKLTYPAPGNPELAQRIHTILQNASIESVLDKKRDFDHGVFIPLKLIYPDADVPIVQISLLSSMSPSQHIKIGQALSPLRDEDYLIIGSGAATHNLREIFSGRKSSWVKGWNEWLSNTLTSNQISKEERTQRLIDWSKAPSARDAHPREEHLIPLHVVAGTSNGESAKQIYDKVVAGCFSLASFQWDN
eukprot:TRINITY_DN3743_c0_g1_i2.p1 TRINITY_DN3743_c0_g1~~TRINITY_DN3743_c0_g1_i2.p1  ORF type:complete len:292 (-),score=62.29 TRINITY_DN3743_c0_g1_i2:1013-1888(-)